MSLSLNLCRQTRASLTRQQMYGSRMINNRGGNPTLGKPISNTQVQCCIFSSILFNMLSYALHFSKNSIRLTNQSATIELYSAVKDQNWLSVLAFSR